MTEYLNKSLDRACALLHENLDNFRDCFRHSCSENNFYPSVKNVDWTTGFCTGELSLIHI